MMLLSLISRLENDIVFLVNGGQCLVDAAHERLFIAYPLLSLVPQRYPCLLLIQIGLIFLYEALLGDTLPILV